jgi:hypothetical protein
MQQEKGSGKPARSTKGVKKKGGAVYPWQGCVADATHEQPNLPEHSDRTDRPGPRKGLPMACSSVSQHACSRLLCCLAFLTATPIGSLHATPPCSESDRPDQLMLRPTTTSVQSRITAIFFLFVYVLNILLYNFGQSSSHLTHQTTRIMFFCRRRREYDLIVGVVIRLPILTT